LPVLLYHEDFKLHDPSPYDHPESPERLDLMLEGLESHGVLGLFKRPEVPVGDVGIYRLVHEEPYFNMVMKRGRHGVEWLDSDTYISPGTHKALERLAGAAQLAFDLITGEGEGLVLLLPRPPGHHAGRSGRAMGAPTLGFCIFNTSALIARLLSRRGRVSVIDFDLHHGNGTQEILYEDPTVQHVDIHQDCRTIYPGTGYPWQVGEGEGAGTKANINLPPGSGDDIFKEAIDAAVELIVDFKPDYIVVSAGFDGYRGDNYMGSIRAGSGSYHYLGARLRELGRPVIVVIDGGYSAGLLRGLPAFIAGLAGLEDPVEDKPTTSRQEVKERFKRNLEEMREKIAEALRSWRR
jgi:acetoin utilization deacetylase AcuC-like enzyme